MIKMGVSPMAAHMFIFYYGTLSMITPPVAIASYAAAGIAQADANKTSFYAVKLATVAFFVPFMFVYGPSLIFEGSPVSIISSAITATIGVFALAVALEGYFKNKIHLIPRIVLFLAAITLMIPGYLTDIIGLVSIAIVFLTQLKTKQN